MLSRRCKSLWWKSSRGRSGYIRQRVECGHFGLEACSEFMETYYTCWLIDQLVAGIKSEATQSGSRLLTALCKLAQLLAFWPLSSSGLPCLEMALALLSCLKIKAFHNATGNVLNDIIELRWHKLKKCSKLQPSCRNFRSNVWGREPVWENDKFWIRNGVDVE